MIEQGTPEWHALRLGKVTASRIANIVRRTKDGVSASRNRYLGELVAERLSGQPTPSVDTADIRWGREQEARAVELYAFLYDVDPEKVVFVDHPLIPMAGASPDRLVNADGLIEVKCPATHTHIDTLRGARIDSDYVKQMQWQMACTGRAWCDFVSFDPRMPERMQMHVQRFQRDDVMISELERAVTAFNADVAAAVADLEARFGRAIAA